MVPLRSKHICNLTLTLYKAVNSESTNVHGCTLLPDGRTVFSCYEQQKVIVLEFDGSKDFEISKVVDMFDVVFIGNNFIAVISGE